MNDHLARAALAAVLFAGISGVAFADEINPQPLPPGLHALPKLADGELAFVNGNHQLLLGASRTPAPAGRYTLADRSIIIVGGKGIITQSSLTAVQRYLTPGSRVMLNPQPLPP